MHIVIFCLTIFEIVLLFFQVIYYMERPSDAPRLRYLILIVLLIAYNVCSGGITPDERIGIPMVLQNIVAYSLGFAVSMYAIYFYYRLFEFQHLKFLATYGLFLFLAMSFLIFVVLYLSTGDLVLSQKASMIIPFFYGVRFVFSATRSLLIKIKESKHQGDVLTDTLYLAITAYVSMVCWAGLPIINFLGDYQLLEHSLTNVGFMLMSIFYIRSVTKQAKEEAKIKLDEVRATEMDQTPQTSAGIPPAESIHSNHYEETIKKYSLSRREIEILPLLIKGRRNKEIADVLHVAEKTVSKHISNIYDKTGVASRVELITKLLPAGRQNVPPGNAETKSPG